MKNNIFIINRGEIENRLDVSAFKKSFRYTSNKYPLQKLSDVVFINPKTTFENLYPDSDISYVPMDAINDEIGEIEYLDIKKVSETKGYTKFKEGDLLWAKITPCMQNGKSAVVKGTINGYACGSTEFFILRPKDDIIKVDYLHYLLRDHRILETAQNFFGGSAGQQRVPIDFLQNLYIPILPLEIQEEIINRINKLRIKLKKKIENSYSLFPTIDKHIARLLGFNLNEFGETNTFVIKFPGFENRLDPHFYLPNFKSLIDNIRKINNKQLGDLVEFSKETWDQKVGFDNEFPYVEISDIDLLSGRINNVSHIPIAETPSRAKMILRNNDIIISTTRPDRGAISLIEQDKDGFIASTGFAVLRLLKTKEVSKEYLFYILRTKICLLQMLQRSTGGSYPAIPVEELKNIYIPIPNISTQQEIVHDIKSFIREAEQLKDDAKADFEKAQQEIETLIVN